MTSGCGDVLSLQDLKTAKLHQIFEAEVITGRTGGVASGAEIDYATNMSTGQVQKTMPAILRDIGYSPATFDFTSGGTLSATDRNKAVLWPIAAGGDGDWYYWQGALPKVIPASSSPASAGGVSDGAWRPVGDITLRSELASSSAGILVSPTHVGYKPPYTGVTQRPLSAKSAELRVSVKDFGAVGDGVTDDTIAFQRAVDSGAAEIFVPSVAVGYVLSAKINITKSVAIVGEGVQTVMDEKATAAGNTRGAGSWLLLNHTGVGLHINGAVKVVYGCSFRRIGTVRQHQTPGAGVFTPTQADFDILNERGADTLIDEVCLLNPYKGIRSTGDSRMWISNIRGQPLNTGIQLDDTFDCHRLFNIHFWVYWAYTPGVTDYTLQNLVAFKLSRADGLMLDNLFTIFSKYGILVYNTPRGTLYNAVMSNIFLDNCYEGIHVDAAAVGASMAISNLQVQGAQSSISTVAPPSQYCIAVYSDSCNIRITNADLRSTQSSVVYLLGNYADVGICNVTVRDWTLSNPTGTAFNVVRATSELEITGKKSFYDNSGLVTGDYYSGIVHTKIASGFQAISTDSGGQATIGFSGNSIPNYFNITAFNNASVFFTVITRSKGACVVKAWSGTAPAANLQLSVGWLAGR